ncbi:cytochrome P450 9e2-like [Diabrotica virgifera virgifera]|uniref:Cytochrome P450 9e2-like n=1 Tax=Diabrotica virgifera virgifera TaxID=50390 RepID=A0A6P7GFW4_DIAVI|nr:cytochrome P450 9e2-like [Diabrotica virgifera virgifera]XP_050505403.1 cytochrome P450 9e2-like [Diabrotica virgifera virgifera]XP_050505409.1 cytochrome P450 9e2-like [Diabrotica virgifera virgifera]XP_050505416.1 cytochrome P450 9e2-like [Diabrotica virgifera virgifera]KAI2474237.1 hypothetical protein C4B38_000304 [Diabrotica virgifera virgifera]KAI2474238.1 hypothetical protein C4B38_000304 [Diabrotica virgifera virgifera]KAI2474239.1 hypothetical protein C4B38_000304 [Diabrotica virg
MWLILIFIALMLLIYKGQNSLNYWRDRGVKQMSIYTFIKGNIKFFLKKDSMAENIMDTYKSFTNCRYAGVYQFTLPVLMIRDPELLKELTVKSFEHFTDHFNIITEEIEPLWAKNLFVLKGQKWRSMRQVLSPSFTSSKMKILFKLISECAQNFTRHFLENEQDVVEIELKDTFTRFTNDVIATSAFGIQTDSLKNKENEFYVMGKRLTSFTGGFLTMLRFFLLVLCPKMYKFLKLGIFKPEVKSFFINLVNDNIKERKEKGIVRPDMLHLLLEAQKGVVLKEEIITDNSFAVQEESTSEETGIPKHVNKLTDEDITSQALIFFFAGFDTVATLMCFMGYELAIHPDTQTKLRNEIQETLDEYQGQLTYEVLLKMKYLDMVVSESLRKWPANVVVDRECTKDYTIQPKLPGEVALHLPEKSSVWLPIIGIHRDPEFYPDPEKFDPERFSDENKHKINPYAYLPFGLGPRNCIGSRFALLEIKIVFFHLLQNFELVPTTKSQIPLKISRQSFTLNAEGGFWFGLKRLQN